MYHPGPAKVSGEVLLNLQYICLHIHEVMQCTSGQLVIVTTGSKQGIIGVKNG